MTENMYNKKVIKSSIMKMYQAAFAAICHCGDNPAGAFSCGCDKTKKTQEAIGLLLKIKREVFKELDLF